MKHLNILTSEASVGNESIAFQDDKFFKELTAIVQQARDGAYSSHAAVCNHIDNCVMRNKRIKTETFLEEGMINGWILPKWLTSTNPIEDREFLKFNTYNEFSRLADQNGILTGLIDDSKARVGGFLSDISHTMCIGSPFIYDSKLCSAEAAAAVILHEVGHAYTFLQFCMGMMVFNVVLSQASTDLAKAKTYEEVKLVFGKAAKDLKISDTTFVNEVTNTENRVVQFEYLASCAARLTPYLLMNDVAKGYSQNACEELADIFAARHGAEKAIMEVRAIFGSETYNIMGALFIKMVSAFTFTGLGATILATGPAGLAFIGSIALVIGVLMISGFLGLLTLGTDFRGITTAPVQIRKMQNQLIERLKSAKGSKINKELIEYVTDGIAYGDSLLSKAKHNESMYFTIAQVFIGSLRDARRLREYQDKLEGLTANRLFLTAARLGA